MSQRDRWIIVGGGASGLAAAFFLRQHGIESEIVERECRIGGRMGTVELGGRTLDCGGKNIGRQYKLFRQFASSLGSHPFEYFGLNSSQVLHGKIHTFDSGSRWRSLLEIARGSSAQDIIRFAKLLLRVKTDETNGYLGSSWSRSFGERYDDAPLSRYFSPEFCRRIIRPMTVRMNGAEPDEVYMGNFASNVRMLLDTYEQFRHGLAPLLGSFLDRYPARLNTATEALLVNDGRVAGVRVRDAHGNVSELHGAGVILATPATIAAELTAPVSADLSQQLRSIAYYPVTLVLAEYREPVFSSTVRALVFDGDQAVSNAGAYGVNDLHLVRYTFSGRASREYTRNGADAGTLVRLGEAALSRHIPFDPRSRRQFVAKGFRHGLCAYTPYHARFLERIDHERRKVAGLYLTGDYIKGVSIEACFRSASACIDRIVNEQTSSAALYGRTADFNNKFDEFIKKGDRHELLPG